MSLENQMNQAMAYIEKNLKNKIDYDEISTIAMCSDTEFRRMFSFLTQISLSEYIRKRRLSQCLHELKNEEKVIDVAYMYQYESQAAFTRAFKKFHGITPSFAKKNDLVSYTYPPLTFKLILMEGIEMDKEKQRVIVGGHGDRYGLTVDMDQEVIHKTNEQFWNTKGNEVIGCLALPLYGAFISEDKCQLLGDLKDRIVLDVCCESGQSLKYVENKGAKELWGIDISNEQLDKCKALFDEKKQPNLICSPMEDLCGLPSDYFDTVYSVYGIGWSTDLDKTFNNIASYLKQDGIFIFSWSHPIHKCVSVEHDALTFRKSYFDEEWYALNLGGDLISLADRKMSTYVNALSKAGFVLEEMVEESHEDLLNASDSKFSQKASMLPVTFVIKARKL